MDCAGRYAAQSKPHNLTKLEFGVSVANVMYRGGLTWLYETIAADVVATAKRYYKARNKAERRVRLHRIPQAHASTLSIDRLPTRLAQGMVLRINVKQGVGFSWQDVEWSEKAQAFAARHEIRGHISQRVGC
jgi:predicted homoserine dehydrogenase-like protein